MNNTHRSIPNGLQPVQTIVGFHENSNGGIELEYATTYVHPSVEEPIDYSSSFNREPPGNTQHLEKYYAESERLKTFDNNWKDSYHVKTIDLARNGFIYKGPKDKVLCIFCQKTLHSWEPHDSVENEHRKHYPHCPFVKGECADKNKPILNSSGMRVKNKASPKHPQMEPIQRRLETFHSWPHSLPRFDELAQAGLFYCGEGDIARCYMCGGELENWAPQDDPWYEHCRNYPACSLSHIRQRPVLHVAGQNGATAHVPTLPSENGTASASNLTTPMQVSTSVDEEMPSALQYTPNIDEDIRGSAAQAVLQATEYSEENVRLALEQLRIAGGPSKVITAEELMTQVMENVDFVDML